MNKKNVEEKEIYETPVIRRQQVVLEQVIAAGSTQKRSDAVVHEWNDEEEQDFEIII